MRVTEEIKVALQKAIGICDSQREFAKKVGISHENICRYLVGPTKTIKQSNWAKLEPVLRPYLSKEAALPVSDASMPVLSHLEAELLDLYRALPYDKQLVALKLVADLKATVDKSPDSPAAGLEAIAG